MSIGQIQGLFSLSLTVSDTARSQDFYGKFGFATDYATTIPIEGGDIKITRMSLGNLVIELTELPAYNSALTDGHFDHMTLRVVNIDEVVADLRAKGVTIEGEVGLNTPFLKNGIKFIMFRGPDGESLALTEEL